MSDEMKFYLIMTVLMVFFAALPSYSRFARNICTPIQWAAAVGYALLYIKSIL